MQADAGDDGMGLVDELGDHLSGGFGGFGLADELVLVIDADRVGREDELMGFGGADDRSNRSCFLLSEGASELLGRWVLIGSDRRGGIVEVGDAHGERNMSFAED